MNFRSGTVLMSSSGARAVARYLASRRSFVQKSDSRVLHSCADVSLMHVSCAVFDGSFNVLVFSSLNLHIFALILRISY